MTSVLQDKQSNKMINKIFCLPKQRKLYSTNTLKSESGSRSFTAMLLIDFKEKKK